MGIVADLHLHSKYSRAVSPQMVLPTMARQARIKGIDLLATGDFTHPLWIKELDSQLEEVSEGIYGVRRDKGDGGDRVDGGLPAESAGNARYILGTEISSIYTQGGKGRRIHTLVFAPSLEVVHQINEKMRQAGCNLMSDGRPIIGLSLIQLCELLFSVDKNIAVVPAHVWTPWFGLYGSKSGFDSLAEAYGEFSDRICAVETGLSSSPLENWRIAELDNRTIISFSDAHSPAKLGRELTVFKRKDPSFSDFPHKIRSTQDDTAALNSLATVSSEKSGKDFTYDNFVEALKQEGDWEIAATVEFYPEEGKYHYTGHRDCKVVQSPEETLKKGTTCHVCGKPLTIGVMHRVDQLAGKEIGDGDLRVEKGKEGVKVIHYGNKPPYMMLVPLLEILSEVLEAGVNTKTVHTQYDQLIERFGSELKVLAKTPLLALEKTGGSRLKEAIAKVRSGDIFINPGYDGVFGKVKIWGGEGSQEKRPRQESLF